MQLTPRMFLIVCPLAFLAGFIDAAAGGGGLISLPAYLAAGLPPRLASGTNKLSASIGTLSATISYARKGQIEWKPTALGVLGALPGAFLGAKLLMIVPEDAVRWLLLFAIPALAALVLLTGRAGRGGEDGRAQSRFLWASLPIGFFVGMYDGFFGPGTGVFLTLLFHGLMRLPYVRASATAKPINLASGVSSLVSFLLDRQVIVLLALPAAAASVAGNLLGARVAVNKGARAVRALLVVALALLLARVAYDLFWA